MKLRDILALFTLIIMVRGAWFAATVQPIILSLGAVLSAVDLDVLDVQLNGIKSWLPFINKQDSTSSTTGTDGKEEEVTKAEKVEE